MIKLSPSLRISFGLICLTMGVLLAADLLGLTPRSREQLLENRQKFAETLSVQLSLSTRQQDMQVLRDMLWAVVNRNDELVSAAIRRADGVMLIEMGEHQRAWRLESDRHWNTSHFQVPLYKGNQPFGQLELRFKTLDDELPHLLLGGLSLPWIGFIALLGFSGYWLLIRRCLRFLDPAAVIPARVRAALDSLAEGILILDEQDRIVLANAAFAAKTQRPEQELLGRKACELGWLRLHNREPVPVLPLNEALPQAFCDGGVPLLFMGQNNQERVFMVHGTPLFDDDGRERGVLASFDDVTELENRNHEMKQMVRQLEQSKEKVLAQNRQLHRLATRDPLTGCMNRRSFFERFSAEFSLAQEEQRELCCIMTDIDHFKNVNDSHGHGMGDQVISLVAGLLQNAVREEDMVGRYGGEEFCILLPGMDITQAEQVAERCRKRIELQRQLELKITASFGIASVKSGAESPESMVDQADQALYVSKESGRNRVTIWDFCTETQMAPVRKADSHRRTMVANMRHALEHDEFLLHYQPQVNPQGEISSAEVLLRWNKPGEGLISPLNFIPVAEESGMIFPIGEWVLLQACHQLRELVHMNPNFKRLAVNVSARQFQHPNFVRQLETILQKTGADPSRLELEITENMLIDNFTDAIDKMNILRALDIRFSIDDFGTGYSSLTYLRHLPLNQLKIDQSFVRDLLTDRNDVAIVNTIIAMASSLELETIAEGVETLEELEMLKQMGCEAFQGYYFSKPLPLEQFTQVLQNQKIRR